jgi:hypothetical protein
MFLAPLFLAGLLAIGLPIWLHRVARANPTQHPFASLMFLEPVNAADGQAHAALLAAVAVASRCSSCSCSLCRTARVAGRRTGAPGQCATYALVLDGRCRCSTASGGNARSTRPNPSSMLRQRPPDAVSAAGRAHVILSHQCERCERAGAQLRTPQARRRRLDYGLPTTTSKAWLGGRACRRKCIC